MMISLLLGLVLLEPQQQLEQQLQRQQQEIERIQRDVQQQVQLLRDMKTLLDRPEIDRPLCTAELRSVNGSDPRKAPAGALTVVFLNLFSIVSKPGSCLPAEIRVSATYLDSGDNLVCSGVIENLAGQNTQAQAVNLEIRPWNLREFARWRNEPPQINSGPKRLVCINPEGLAEATSEELARVASVRVRATVLPANGGMSTQEAQFSLR